MKSIFVLFILTITIVTSVDIYKLKQPQLAKLAIDIEAYVRKVKNFHLLGGLHDYAYSLDEETLIYHIEKYIMQEGSLVTDFINGKSNLRKSRIEVMLENSLIVTFLSKFNKKTLFALAFEIEALTRKRLARPIVGGLHDNISEDMPEKDIALAIESYILDFKLISVDELIEMTIRLEIGSLEKTKLVSLGIKLEEALKKKYNKTLFGGLHDYISTLTPEEIVNQLILISDQFGDKAKIELLKLIERI